MIREKFVVRLLNPEGDLLSWAEVYAEPKPQDRGGSCPFWPSGPTVFHVERFGLATEITVHWCDLDVARRAPIVEPLPVEVGQLLTFAWLEPVWLVHGARDVPLPAVTLRKPVEIAVPTGNLVAVTPV